MAHGTPPPQQPNPPASLSTGTDWNTFLQGLVTPGLIGGFGVFATWFIGLPNQIRPIVLGLLAVCAALFYWLNIRADQPIRAGLTAEEAQEETKERAQLRRRTILATSGSLFVLVALAISWTVPSPNEEDSAKREAADAKNGAPLTGGQLKSAADRLDYEFPPNNEKVSRCFRVRGRGTVPQGYGLWVVHQNNETDERGVDKAVPGAYFSLVKASYAEDSKEWETDIIRVGSESSSENGKYYWVSVYLVPPVTNALLQKLGGGKGITISSSPKTLSDSIHAPAVRVKQVKIHRTSGTTC
ncbi:hypothetical protein [Streptomyces canus]|uniref:hypothetical protein n=1 Tax=Streptomyces canus TaxID=58343 RepID=UPI000A94C9B2|nr:hypothetical protein [Streptomyces canus]